MIFVIPKLLCVLTYLYVSCGIQQYPEIYYYHDNKIIIFITIMNLLSIYLNYRTALKCTYESITTANMFIIGNN